MRKKILLLSALFICLAFIASDCSRNSPVVYHDPLGGYGAMRLYTSNSGNNWHSLYNMTHSENGDIHSIQRVSCFSDDLRYLTIIGTDNNHTYRTTNLGGSWTPNFLNGSDYQAMTSSSLDGTGFLTSFHKLWSTSDDGSSWTVLNNPYNNPTYYIAVDFCSQTNGICIPENPGDTIIYTTNGGIDWQQGSVITNSAYMSDIKFISSSPGTGAMVCGNSGRIFRTTDIGVSWEQITSPVNEDFNRLDFIDPVGIIVGSGGTILRTVNRGLNWSIIPSGVTNNLRSVYLEGSYYWIVGDNVILRSSDQGQTWNVVRSASDEFYTDMVFIKNQGVVVGNKRK